MSLIYLGNLTEVDTNEFNWGAENPNAILGTYSAFDTMLPITITNHDTNFDGTISDDENDEMGGSATDYVSYTLDGVTYTPQVDNSAIYSAKITELDSTTATVNVVVFQMANGDTFVGDLGGTLDNLEIRQIELLSEVSSAYSGYSNDFSVSNTAVCFAEGTRIRTICGEVPVEELRPGAALKTRDNGYQLLLWIGGTYFASPGRQAPVLFDPGALGSGMPRRALMLSPQHRVLIRSPVARRMFGQDEVFLPAFRLAGLPGISRAPPGEPVVYWHLLCARHEIVEAEGAPVESLLPGPMARDIAKGAWDADLLQLAGMRGPVQAARLVPDAAQQKRLVMRLAQNRKSPVEAAF